MSPEKTVEKNNRGELRVVLGVRQMGTVVPMVPGVESPERRSARRFMPKQGEVARLPRVG